MDPAALYDALNLASLAALLFESGDVAQAENMLMDARLAAVDALPFGSADAAILNAALDIVAKVPAEASDG